MATVQKKNCRFEINGPDFRNGAGTEPQPYRAPYWAREPGGWMPDSCRDPMLLVRCRPFSVGAGVLAMGSGGCFGRGRSRRRRG
jgi:hypothetical protein